MRYFILFLFILGSFSLKASEVDTCRSISCKSNISLLIDYNETWPLNPAVFLNEPWCRSKGYFLRDDRGRRIDSIDNSMWGKQNLTIVDDEGLSCDFRLDVKIRGCGNLFRSAPLGRYIEVDCLDSLEYQVLGMPIPDTAKYYLTNHNRLVVENWSPCEVVVAHYNESHVTGSCDDDFSKIIYRHWTFTNSAGVELKMEDTIVTAWLELSDIPALPNYDGFDKPKLDCGDEWFKQGGTPPVELTGDLNHFNLCCGITVGYEDIELTTTWNRCYKTTKIARKWWIGDWCAKDERVDIQLIVYECGADEEPPQARCLSEVEVVLNAQGEYRLFAEAVNDGSSDDCEIDRFTFDREGDKEFIDFTIDDTVGVHDLTLYVFDYAKGVDSCQVQVNVEAYLDSEAQLGGRFLDYNLNRLDRNVAQIPDMRFSVSNQNGGIGATECTAPSGLDLDYTLCWDSDEFPGPYSLNVIDQVEEEFLEGIDVIDILLLQDYLLGLGRNDYRSLAGDIGGNLDISASDVVELRRLLLGLEDFAGNFWFYYSSDADGNPILVSDTLNAPNLEFPIIPVRVGDFDRPGLSDVVTPEPDPNEEVVLYMVDRFQPRGAFDLVLRSDEDWDLSGMQWSLTWDLDKLIVNEVENRQVGRSSVQWNLEDTVVKVIHHSAFPFPFRLNSEIFKFSMFCSEEGMLSDLIPLDKFPLKLMGAKPNGQPVNLRIEWRDRITSSEDELRYELRLFPNPSSSELFLESDGPIEQWTIYDMDGAAVMSGVQKSSGNIHIIDLSQIRNSGMYFVHVTLLGEQTPRTLKFIKE